MVTVDAMSINFFLTYFDSFPRSASCVLQISTIFESSNGDICGMGGPIDFAFDSRVEVDECYMTVYRMTRSKVKVKVTDVQNL